MLQLRHTGCRRILRTHTSVECGFLGLYAQLVYRQAGRTLVHAYKWYSGLLFEILRHKKHFANGSFRQVGDVKFFHSLFHQLFTEYFHRFLSLYFTAFNPKSNACWFISTIFSPFDANTRAMLSRNCSGVSISI